MFLSFVIAGAYIILFFWVRDHYTGENCPHPSTSTTDYTRWLQITDKKNHAPTMLLEVRTMCRICDREARVRWFTEEQCQKYGIRAPRPSAS